MALLHPLQCSALSSQLDLFTLPASLSSTETSSVIEYRPIAPLQDGGLIEFYIPGNTDFYQDLSTITLAVRCSVVKADGAALTAAESGSVAITNNFLHSLWQQVDVTLNSRQVSGGAGNYGYAAYLQTLLSYSKEAKEHQLTNVGWCQADSETDSFTARAAACALSRTLDLRGRLMVDFLVSQPKLLLNNVDLRIALTPAKDAFCLQTKGGLTAKVKLHDVALHVRRMKPVPAVLVAHDSTLQTVSAKYPFQKVGVKTFTINSGVKSATLDNIYLGQLPNRIIIGLVSHNAYTGNIASNPFQFQSHGLSSVSLSVNGENFPVKPMIINTTQGRYVDAFNSLYDAMGALYKNESLGISPDAYKDHCFLIGFDVTPDGTQCAGSIPLVRQGSARLDITFEKNITENLTLVCLGVSDQLVEVTRERDVLTDF